MASPLVKKFPTFYGAPNIHEHIHKSQPLVIILSQINLIFIMDILVGIKTL